MFKPQKFLRVMPIYIRPLTAQIVEFRNRILGQKNQRIMAFGGLEEFQASKIKLKL